MLVKNFGLYALVLISGLAVVIAAFGGGAFQQENSWQLQAFYYLCHQDPGRSFWMNGQPMAVCSRCLGIYSSFLTGWMMLPAFPVFKINLASAAPRIVAVSVLLNFLDIIGNMLGIWENTLTSRLLLGWLVGWSVASLFSGDFFNRT